MHNEESHFKFANLARTRTYQDLEKLLCAGADKDLSVIGSVHWLALVPTDIRNADDELYSKVRYLIQDEGEHNSYFMESILL